MHSLYFKFAVKIWALLQTRVAEFPSFLPVFDKVYIFRNIIAFSIYQHWKSEQEIRRLGKFARDDFGIPLRRKPLSVYLCGVFDIAFILR